MVCSQILCPALEQSCLSFLLKWFECCLNVTYGSHLTQEHQPGMSRVEKDLPHGAWRLPREGLRTHVACRASPCWFWCGLCRQPSAGLWCQVEVKSAPFPLLSIPSEATTVQFGTFFFHMFIRLLFIYSIFTYEVFCLFFMQKRLWMDAHLGWIKKSLRILT